MVVGFHLHKQGHGLFLKAIARRICTHPKALRFRTLKDGSVIAVGRQNARTVHRSVGVTNHGKEGLGRHFAVNNPVRVEDLVPAMLRVRLGEHHEFRIRGIPTKGCEGLCEIGNFVVGKGKAPGVVGLSEGRRPLPEQGHGAKGPGRLGRKEGCAIAVPGKQGFSHAIEERRRDGRPLRLTQGAGEVPAHPALHPPDRPEPTAMKNICGFRRPGRLRSRPGHHQR